MLVSTYFIGLCERITGLLTNYFIKCPPMSIKGTSNQLDEIENLLVKWISENQANSQALEALVALSCARDSIDTAIRTIDLMLSNEITSEVKNFDFLSNVLKSDYKDQKPKVLDVSCHSFGFHYTARYN